MQKYDIRVSVLRLAILHEPSYICLMEPAVFLRVKEFFAWLLEHSSSKQRIPWADPLKKTKSELPRTFQYYNTVVLCQGMYQERLERRVA